MWLGLQQLSLARSEATAQGSARFLEHAAVAVVHAHAPARPGPTWRAVWPSWRAAPKSETSPFLVETKRRLQPDVQ